MLIKLKNWLKNTPIDQQKRGMSWITETLPMYHDRARSTNKTIWTIKKMMTDEVAEACRLGSSRLEHKDIADMVMLSQNGIPIRFKPNGKLLSHEPFFEKEGYKVGQIYSFERLGFLGDIDSIKQVFCVTDQYVLFKYLDSKGISAVSFKELEIFSPKLK